MLHGFGGTGRDWGLLLENFSHYRLIVPDLRGHGHSTNPSGQFTNRESALDIFALLDRLGVDTFSAIGVSAGGMTLLHMATAQPERVKAMVLIGASSYIPLQSRELVSDPEGWPVEILETWPGLAHSRGLEQARELAAQFFAFMRDNYDDMNFTPPYLSTITASTLIVHGDRDEFFPVSIPVEEYEAIPDSYLWIVPNGGHEPLLGSERGRTMFSELVLEFLAGKWQ
jgi:pimeloyl-ACP methyl ester carboxylesterase